jgi:hypothetical protein
MENLLTKAQFRQLQDVQKEPATFNFYGAISRPKSITVVQMTEDFKLTTEIGTFDGKKGDYLFKDAAGGKMIVHEEVFQKIHGK